MGNHEATRDAFYALFGLLVLLHAWFGISGFLRLLRLRAGLPPAVGVSWKLGFRDVPNQQVSEAFGPAWRHAAAWNDLCAGLAGVVASLLAIPVAVALPMSSWYSTTVLRGIVLTGLAVAFSGVGSLLGRCIAITWITPPATTIGDAPPSLGRRRVTAQAMALWAVDAAVTLLVAIALATTVQTPSARSYLVRVYMVLVLSFPVLLGVRLAAETCLGQRWRALVRSVLLAAPNLPATTVQVFRSFAGTFMTGRTMAPGVFVGMGQFLFTMWIASYEPYFTGIADIATICAFVAALTGLLTLAIPVTSFTLPRDEEAPTMQGGLPAS